jgi:hypothetical protein
MDRPPVIYFPAHVQDAVAAQYAGAPPPGGAVVGLVATRPEALAELMVPQLLERARREGSVPEEIEEARNNVYALDDDPRVPLRALILCTSAWRATELRPELEARDLMALVALATRPSISRAALESARNTERPMQALVRLLLSTPDFVVEQRRAHIHRGAMAPPVTIWTYAGAAGAGAVGGAMVAAFLPIGAPGDNFLLLAPCYRTCDLVGQRDLLTC